MNQLESLRRDAQRLHGLVAGPERQALRADAIQSLRSIVGASQNRPPEGTADGSVDEYTWNAAQGLVLALGALQHAESTIHRLIGKILK